jgi:hypothetical protein
MMRRKILYAKIGRSMPLTLAKCGTLGGDIEMTATLTALARAYSDDEIILIGRNTGENPRDVGLPENIINPWTEWGPELRRFLNTNELNHPNLSVDEHKRALAFIMDMTGDTFLTDPEDRGPIGLHQAAGRVHLLLRLPPAGHQLVA